MPVQVLVATVGQVSTSNFLVQHRVRRSPGTTSCSTTRSRNMASKGVQCRFPALVTSNEVDHWLTNTDGRHNTCHGQKQTRRICSGLIDMPMVDLDLSMALNGVVRSTAVQSPVFNGTPVRSPESALHRPVSPSPYDFAFALLPQTHGHVGTATGQGPPVRTERHTVNRST